MYGLGATKIRVDVVENKPLVRLHVPLSFGDGRVLLGCWRESETQIAAFHAWSHLCEHRMPLSRYEPFIKKD